MRARDFFSGFFACSQDKEQLDDWVLTFSGKLSWEYFRFFCDSQGRGTPGQEDAGRFVARATGGGVGGQGEDGGDGVTAVATDAGGRGNAFRYCCSGRGFFLAGCGTGGILGTEEEVILEDRADMRCAKN